MWYIAIHIFFDTKNTYVKTVAIRWQIFIKVNRHIRTLEYFFLFCRFLLTNVLRYFFSRLFIFSCCCFFLEDRSFFPSKSCILRPRLEICAPSGKMSKTARFERTFEFLWLWICENIWFDSCSFLSSFGVCWGAAWFNILWGSVVFPAGILFRCSCWSSISWWWTVLPTKLSWSFDFSAFSELSPDFQSFALLKETTKSVIDRTTMLPPLVEPFWGTDLTIVQSFCWFYVFISDCSPNGVSWESVH